MDAIKFNTKIIIVTLIYATAILAIAQNGYSQKAVSFKEDNSQEKKNYLATSVFVLSSLIPDDNTFFFEIDYGRRLNPKNDLIVGVNIYKYTSPMSASWSDPVTYPGHVLSYGVVLAYQHYFWKKLFIDQIINPLLLDYYDNTKNKTGTGFMVLCATRIGYHFDISLFKKPFYLEVGGEYSYWPYNGNVPDNFKIIDAQYKSYVPSPVLQVGYKF
ncbi:MAG: hypothetical protein JXJ22_18035 [Bacteroidales bacterium]|nr:hypothetical protein [Bacteroidales bacterium]